MSDQSHDTQTAAQSEPAAQKEPAEPGDTPRDFNSLRALIVARRGGLPKRLVQVADFAVEHPQEIAFSRVADLATQAGVQPSTLVRFAQTLGYSGFSDLQAVFRAHARQRWPDYHERLESLADAAPGRDAAPVAILHSFVHASHVSLEHLEQTVDVAALDKAVGLLAGAGSITLLAVRRAYPVAVYLTYALRRLGLRCEGVDLAGGLAQRQVDLLGPQDVLLAISFTPYAPETIRLAALAAERGARVVGITDSPFSPLTQSAETWIEVAETDHAGFRSLSATFALATTLAVAAAERRAHRTAEA